MAPKCSGTLIKAENLLSFSVAESWDSTSFKPMTRVTQETKQQKIPQATKETPHHFNIFLTRNVFYLQEQEGC